MDSKRLLAYLATDFGRLREVAAGADLTAPVPSCPDWTVADLVRHVGAVYLDKVGCMRDGRHQEWPPEGIDEEESLAVLDRGYAALTAEFAAREPAAPSFTWYGPDQTVGFWIRRMAHETAIHRVDAELGAGAPVGGIPVDLAQDGIDEFLVAFVEYGSRTWPEGYAEALATADGRAVRVETADGAWLIRPTPTMVEVRVSDVDQAEAVVRGEPDAVLLWLWGRTGDDAVSVSGDRDLIRPLRRVLVVAGA
jgi:uncharacterized protein (TIGR03083 family)